MKVQRGLFVKMLHPHDGVGSALPQACHTKKKIMSEEKIINPYPNVHSGGLVETTFNVTESAVVMFVDTGVEVTYPQKTHESPVGKSIRNSISVGSYIFLMSQICTSSV